MRPTVGNNITSGSGVSATGPGRRLSLQVLRRDFYPPRRCYRVYASRGLLYRHYHVAYFARSRPADDALVGSRACDTRCSRRYPYAMPRRLQCAAASGPWIATMIRPFWTDGRARLRARIQGDSNDACTLRRSRREKGFGRNDGGKNAFFVIALESKRVYASPCDPYDTCVIYECTYTRVRITYVTTLERFPKSDGKNIFQIPFWYSWKTLIDTNKTRVCRERFLSYSLLARIIFLRRKILRKISFVGKLKSVIDCFVRNESFLLQNLSFVNKILRFQNGFFLFRVS